jgi:hypothetical protein
VKDAIKKTDGEDYRLTVRGNLFIPVWQCAAKLPPAVWWPHLGRAVLVFDDLECDELFNG